MQVRYPHDDNPYKVTEDTHSEATGDLVNAAFRDSGSEVCTDTKSMLRKQSLMSIV